MPVLRQGLDDVGNRMLASAAIERKLPALNNKRFSESTCDALLDLVLRSCSIEDSSSECHAMQQIASKDGIFAEWFAVMPSGTFVAEALLREPSWRDVTAASERLWQMANLAVRLRTLEHRFTEELAVQKREAIYHFAYGLSHELNNPLANIATRAGVLAHRESTLENRQMLETIIDNAMRGSEMLGDLMLLARPPKLNPQSVNPTIWFDTFLARCTVWATWCSVTLDSRCDFQSPSVSFDPVALTEAAWCLMRNAFEASKEGDSLQIHLEEAGEQLCLSICDCGPGLSSKAMQNCYDPYFSGREAGRGLGLGLSKAQRIATMHGGTVEVSNRPTGGCKAVLTVSVVNKFAN